MCFCRFNSTVNTFIYVPVFVSLPQPPLFHSPIGLLTSKYTYPCIFCFYSFGLAPIFSCLQADPHHVFAEKILNPDGGDEGKDFRLWTFNIFSLETEELGLFAATILEYSGLPRVFGLSIKVATGREGGVVRSAAVYTPLESSALVTKLVVDF